MAGEKRVLVLVGAGGHGKVVADALAAMGRRIAGYVDRREVEWPKVRRVATTEGELDPRSHEIVIGLGGVTPDALARRLVVVEALLRRGFSVPVVAHPAAWVSPSARLEAGTVVLAGAMVQAAAVIGHGVIVNTRAVVEHDAVLGDGAQVAPGAIVLGGATVGRASMIGAGAVVLQQASVPAATLVRAVTLWRGTPAGKRKKS
ncbi:MAG: hypothetical protein FJX47_00195 [Alphaproteobacteria bacterium]|nr:hypothetical protein [Alphaproteobacteria bacterium]